MKVNKEKAVELRQLGFSYKEISETLGCSFAWCAKNLNGVERGETRVETVVVDATKEKAIAILKDALKKLEEM